MSTTSPTPSKPSPPMPACAQNYRGAAAPRPSYFRSRVTASVLQRSMSGSVSARWASSLLREELNDFVLRVSSGPFWRMVRRRHLAIGGKRFGTRRIDGSEYGRRAWIRVDQDRGAAFLRRGTAAESMVARESYGDRQELCRGRG